MWKSYGCFETQHRSTRSQPVSSKTLQIPNKVLSLELRSMFWKRSERTISKKGSASQQLFSISPNIILLISTPLDVEVWHVNKWLDHCYFKSKENPLKHLPAKVLMVGRSKSQSACAMRHCCAGKAKKFWNVPEADAMDGKTSIKKILQMQLTKFVPRMKSFASFAMCAK